MTTIILVVHLLLALALVGVILLQRSEGGGLGIGGSGTAGGLMSVRGTANLLTRATAVLAVAFVLTSLALAILASRSGNQESILDSNPTPVAAPAQPADSDASRVPLSK